MLRRLKANQEKDARFMFVIDALMGGLFSEVMCDRGTRVVV